MEKILDNVLLFGNPIGGAISGLAGLFGKRGEDRALQEHNKMLRKQHELYQKQIAPLSQMVRFQSGMVQPGEEKAYVTQNLLDLLNPNTVRGFLNELNNKRELDYYRKISPYNVAPLLGRMPDLREGFFNSLERARMQKMGNLGMLGSLYQSGLHSGMQKPAPHVASSGWGQTASVLGEGLQAAAMMPFYKKMLEAGIGI